jgi:WD40 repeat protein
MDFTEIYPQSSNLVAYSPGNQFLLTARENKLIIRRAQTLQITHVWQLTNTSDALSEPQITQLGWSCDSEYVSAVCANDNFVSVHKLRDESWCARIDAGVEGLSKAHWAPDGRTLLCFSDWSLRVTIWSLVAGKAVSYIQYPSDCDRGEPLKSTNPFLCFRLTLHQAGPSDQTAGILY